jgi:L-asparaginase II
MCSGFHAASLLMSAHAGWSLDDYPDPAHPSQVAVRETVARVLGVSPASLRTSPDDCGLLTYEVRLVDLARAYLVLADPDASGGGGRADAARARLAPALRRIRDAMMEAPDMVGGTSENLDTQLMRRRPGRLVSKAGGDGLRAIGFVPGTAAPGGDDSIAGDTGSGEAGGGTAGSATTEPGAAAGAMAIKIEDGDHSRRAIRAASVEALAQVGILDERDLRALATFHHPVVQTPDRREAATAVPRFELAPLSELA